MVSISKWPSAVAIFHLSQDQLWRSTRYASYAQQAIKRNVLFVDFPRHFPTLSVEVYPVDTCKEPRRNIRNPLSQSATNLQLLESLTYPFDMMPRARQGSLAVALFGKAPALVIYKTCIYLLRLNDDLILSITSQVLFVLYSGRHAIDIVECLTEERDELIQRRPDSLL